MAKTVREDWFNWLDNTLVGNDPNDINEEFRGGDGNDKIGAGVGDDWVRGQNGNDTLFGDQGDDVVDGGDGNDRIAGGEGRDELNGGAGDDKLFFSGEDAYSGGSGTDTFDARSMGYINVSSGGANSMSVIISDTQGVRIGLEEGIAEFRGTGSARNEDHYGDEDVILSIGRGDASFSSIEVYDLTDFGDYFQGDDTSDTIRGFAGDDVIEGKGGADTIDGGTGIDTVDYGSQGTEGFGVPADTSNDTGVNVDLERGTGLIGDAEGDTYTSIENIRGTSFIDALSGDDGVNSIMGRGGNDFIEGRGGADVIDGGSGIDEASYASSTAGVSIDLTRAAQLFGDAAGDTLIDIENVRGSDFADTLRGNSGANTLNGGKGQDSIDGGFGNDIMIGGSETDTASFTSHDPSGLSLTGSANITLGQNGGAGSATFTSLSFGPSGFSTSTETDQLFSFENVRGSNLTETITGNEQTNLLEGRGGNDTLRGEGGADVLIGGAGADTLFGGAQSDIFLFQAASDMPTFVNGILALEQIADFQDAGTNQDVIDFAALRTSTGGRLFLDDHDNQGYERGEVMINTLDDGHTYLSADLNGDGNADFAVSFDRLITTLDSTDFVF